MTKTKKAISKSLLCHHKHQKVLKDCKLVGGFILTVLLVSQIWGLVKPLPLEADTYRNNYLPVARGREIPMREWVLNKVRAEGLDIEIVDCLIKHESGWRTDAIGANRNRTYDAGLWQINSIHGLSVEDALDYKKSTVWAIKKIKHDGNYNAWYGYLNNCK